MRSARARVELDPLALPGRAGAGRGEPGAADPHRAGPDGAVRHAGLGDVLPGDVRRLGRGRGQRRAGRRRGAVVRLPEGQPGAAGAAHVRAGRHPDRLRLARRVGARLRAGGLHLGRPRGDRPGPAADRRRAGHGRGGVRLLHGGQLGELARRLRHDRGARRARLPAAARHRGARHRPPAAHPGTGGPGRRSGERGARRTGQDRPGDPRRAGPQPLRAARPPGGGPADAGRRHRPGADPRTGGGRPADGTGRPGRDPAGALRAAR